MAKMRCVLRWLSTWEPWMYLVGEICHVFLFYCWPPACPLCPLRQKRPTRMRISVSKKDDVAHVQERPSERGATSLASSPRYTMATRVEVDPHDEPEASSVGVEALALPSLLLADCDDIRERSFLPPRFREEGDSVFRRWAKSDLYRHPYGTIGRGSFGKVMVVTMGIGGEKLAVKAIPNVSPKGRNQEKYIVREANFLRICSVHPNVVGYHGLISTVDKTYVIMQLARSNIRRLLKKRGRLAELQAAPLVQQLLSAVKFIHEKRIIHGDLKPANLLLNSEGKLMLADFGLARVLPSEGATISGAHGSKPYMSPEQVSGQPYGTDADLWAVGVVTHELIHGETPFCPSEVAEGSSASRINHTREGEKILAGDYKSDNELVGMVGADFISKLLTPNRMFRTSAMAALRHSWLGGRSVALVSSAVKQDAIEEAEAEIAADNAVRQAILKRTAKVSIMEP